MRLRQTLLPLFVGALALCSTHACVPADEAVGLGSVQFTLTASPFTAAGVPSIDEAPASDPQFKSIDHYHLDFDRILIGFRTMTVGKIGAPDTCSYRGRGAVSDAVFSPLGPTRGLVQTFNGISPVKCPDVGAIFGAPTNQTVVDANATSTDLIELARNGYHAIIDATATPTGEEPGLPTKIQLRFEPLLTSTRFGGCRVGATEEGRGTQIKVGERDTMDVLFAAENLFRQAISSSVPFRVRPFVQADERGDNDGITTMEELDDLPLSVVIAACERDEEDDCSFYQVPPSTTSTNIAGTFASLGDFVRFLFRFTLLYRSPNGLCTGNEPGSEE